MTAIDFLPLAFVAAVAFAVDRIARLFVRVRQPTMEELRQRVLHRRRVAPHVGIESQRHELHQHGPVTRALGEELNALRVQMAARGEAQ